MDSKNLMVEKIKAQLDALDVEIDNLESEGAACDTEKRSSYKNNVEELRVLLADAREKLNELSHSNDETWESFKNDLGDICMYAKSTLTETKKAFQEGLKGK